MPKTSTEILSLVQNSLGDLAMERIQPGEYIDAFNLVVNDVAKDTEIYLARYITQPFQGCENWVNNKSYAKGAIVKDEGDGNFYRCIATVSGTNSVVNKQPLTDVTNTYWLIVNEYSASATYTLNDYVYVTTPTIQFWKCLKTGTQNEPPGDYGNQAWESVIIGQPHTVTIPYTDPTTGQLLSPYLLTKVTRVDRVVSDLLGDNTEAQFNETREYSIQAVQRTHDGAAAFGVNNMDIDYGFGTHFVDKNMRLVKDSRTLVFAKPFSLGETVIIDFIQSEPYNIVAWHEYEKAGSLPGGTTMPFPPVDIPNFLYNAYRWGLQWNLSEKLYHQGDDSFLPRADRARQFFDKYLRDAMSYSHMLLDKNSVMQSQPIIWLGED